MYHVGIAVEPVGEGLRALGLFFFLFNNNYAHGKQRKYNEEVEEYPLFITQLHNNAF
jgi:hypothetical protein